MDKYIQVHFPGLRVPDQEILIAQLSEISFEGFEQGVDFLNAYIPEENFSEVALHTVSVAHGHTPTISIIEQKNWNQEWEKSFEPVIIKNFCAIRASFHDTVPGVVHEIIITPKMSFGTGHHATTFQVIELMEQTDFTNRTVLDFGTGTGVLAILAEKLGAKDVLAIDNDEWSIRNAQENIEANKCSLIRLQKVQELVTRDTFDVILANINKHVILENLPSIAKHLHRDGVVILSGLLKDDQQEITDAASKEKLFVKTQSQKYDWIALSLTNVNSV